MEALPEGRRPVDDWHDRNQTLRVCLATDNFGAGFSQISSCQYNTNGYNAHLGRKVLWRDLSPVLRSHVLKRLLGDVRLYEVINYDVWGNKRDGFEVNDAHYTGLDVFIHEYDRDKDIIRALKEAGFLNKACRYSSFEVDGEWGYSLYINKITDDVGGLYPVCELRIARG